MTSKISSYPNRPTPLGADKPAARARDTAAAPADKAAAGSPVRITDQARQLAALEQAVRSAPIVDEARVAAIRTAIEEGSYEVAPERIADKLLALDQDLHAAEK